MEAPRKISPPRFVAPVEGSVWHDRTGTPTDAGLRIPVCLEWPEGGGRPLWINGRECRPSGGLYAAETILTDEENLIEACLDPSPSSPLASTRVVYDRASIPRYRLAIDDNIYFLEDIARERPRSLFECFYLRELRALHRRYGVKVVLNLFYETPDGSFNLGMFPDHYRGEFADHADWLTLAFHARSEFPDRPYQSGPPETLAADYDLVAEEILRFADEASYSPTTITHWAMVRPDAWPVLASRGSRRLSGFFTPNRGSKYQTDGESLATGGCGESYDINYCMDDTRSAILNRADQLRDFATGITFSKVDLVCNNTPLDRVVPVLEELRRHPATSEVMDLVTHEQYFWPAYPNFIPDHFERCEAAIRWCAEHDYQPAFFHQGVPATTPNPSNPPKASTL